VESLEQIKSRIEAAVSGARAEVIVNGSPAGPNSLLLDNDHALAVAKFLRDTPDLAFDYASNVTGVDWLEATLKKTVKVKQTVEGVEKEVDQVVEEKKPGFLEVVYHLFSMRLKHGPLVLRLRTEDRAGKARVPSLTPVWRGAEFQEREIFDLYGVTFDGHPDLRRILMWDEYKDHPMRKDYAEPDDYEYEPTAHGAIVEKTKQHQAREAGQ
jgi:NADH-quinone oxidoreductase subunit C